MNQAMASAARHVYTWMHGKAAPRGHTRIAYTSCDLL